MFIGLMILLKEETKLWPPNLVLSDTSYLGFFVKDVIAHIKVNQII